MRKLILMLTLVVATGLAQKANAQWIVYKGSNVTFFADSIPQEILSEMDIEIDVKNKKVTFAIDWVPKLELKIVGGEPSVDNFCEFECVVTKRYLDNYFREGEKLKATHDPGRDSKVKLKLEGHTFVLEVGEPVYGTSKY